MNSHPSSRPCVFFDRDGIINRSPGPGYVERVEDFHLLPDFIPALKVAHDAGYAAVVVTNQRGVSLGRMTMADIDAIHDRLLETVRGQGLDILDIYVCPHERGHPDRKPSPRMIRQAAEKHNLDLSRSWMIGDHEIDVQAGQGAGCRTVLIRRGAEKTSADFRLDDVSELPHFLKKHLR